MVAPACTTVWTGGVAAVCAGGGSFGEEDEGAQPGGIGTNLVGALSENRNISQAKLEAPAPASLRMDLHCIWVVNCARATSYNCFSCFPFCEHEFAPGFSFIASFGATKSVFDLRL